MSSVCKIIFYEWVFTFQVSSKATNYIFVSRWQPRGTSARNFFLMHIIYPFSEKYLTFEKWLWGSEIQNNIRITIYAIKSIDDFILFALFVLSIVLFSSHDNRNIILIWDHDWICINEVIKFYLLLHSICW